MPAKLKILLNETNETYYWIGFLFADGHFSKKHALQITLARKDKHHLYKLYNYIQCNNTIYYNKKSKSYGFQVMDSKYIQLIKHKFDISSNKTYNPPTDIVFQNTGLYLSFLIGFIDGDGSIRNQYRRKDSCITIKIHASWSSFVDKLVGNLYALLGLKTKIGKISKKGYYIINISNSKVIDYLNKFRLHKLSTFVLLRKWDKINIDYYSRTDDAKARIETILLKNKQKYRNIDIARELNVSKSYITNVLKRYENVLVYV
jgi:hypothetical protein